MKQFRNAIFTMLAAAMLPLLFSGCDTDGDGDSPPKLPKTWNPEFLGDSYIVINKIAFGKGIFAAVGRKGGTQSYATYSSDDGGLLWRTNAQYESFSTENMHCFFGGGWFVAHPSSAGNSHWSKSKDGKNWTAIGNSTTWRGVGDYPYINSKGGAYGNGYWAVGGSGGRISYSRDLVNWTLLERERTKFDHPQGGPKTYINAVSFGKGKFVAGGGSGHIVWATNPAGEWYVTERRDIPENWANGGEIVETIFDNGFINAIVFSEEKGRFVAVGGLDGRTGKAAYSDDGIHWKQGGDLTEIGVGVDCSMTSAAYGGGIFLISDSKGHIAYSIDGILWTSLGQIHFTEDSAGSISSLCYGNGKWLAASGSRIACSVPE